MTRRIGRVDHSPIDRRGHVLRRIGLTSGTIWARSTISKTIEKSHGPRLPRALATQSCHDPRGPNRQVLRLVSDVMDEAASNAWEHHRPRHDHVESVVCPAPWVSLEFDPAGWVLACCAGHMYPLGRVGDERLADIWNGDRSEALRDAMRNWDLTVACGPCRWHLEHGRVDPVAAVYDAYPMTASQPTAPYMMQFALSNTCNLACVMCNGELSSRIRRRDGLAPLSSRYDETFFADVEPLLAGASLLKFQGGEPFLVTEHQRIWEMAARQDPKPRLLITTNGTVFNETVEWVLDTFVTDISISIDAATPEMYRQVRGGDLDTVHRNLDRFERACHRGGGTLHVSYCLMGMNIAELAPFLAWADRFDGPASVNVVTEEHLALHDLGVDQLEAVTLLWDEQNTQFAFGKNQPVWDTQRAQLAAVLAERRAGIPPPPRQPQRANEWPTVGEESGSAPVVSASASTESAAATQLVNERDRLASWAQGGAVGHLVCELDGQIVAVVARHPRLNLGTQLVGEHINDVLTHISSVDGRPLWVLDIDHQRTSGIDGTDRTVRTFGLTATAQRGTPGTIVRTVELRVGDRSHILIAEDRIYERLEIPVAVGSPRRGQEPA